MKKLTLAVVAVMLALGARGAWADGPFPTVMTDGGTGGPVGIATPTDNTNEIEIYQAVDQLLGSAVYNSNGQLAPLEVTGNNAVWTNTGNGGYAFISIGAGNTNALNVYTIGTPGTLTNTIGGYSGNNFLGNGTPGDPYPGVGSVVAPGTQFGFALTSTNPGGTATWYSQSSLNSDKMDHMIAYNLSALNGDVINVVDPNTDIETQVTLENAYVLGFEDTVETNSVTGAPSDLDYNDAIFLVDGVAPVPEPATWALLIVGLMGVGIFTLRRKFAFVK